MFIHHEGRLDIEKTPYTNPKKADRQIDEQAFIMQ